MKNELQNLTEDISRLYEEITQKTESLGQIDSITRLYDELQSQLQSISSEEVDLLQSQIKSTLEQMVGISKSLAVIKTLKTALNGHDDMVDHIKKTSEWYEPAPISGRSVMNGLLFLSELSVCKGI